MTARDTPAPAPTGVPVEPLELRTAPALQRNAQIPLYLQIKSHLNDIVSRADHGAKMPSEHDVANHFSVSRHVARQALNRLVSEGKVNSRHGAGYFVNSQTIQRSLPALESFTTSMSRRGIAVNHEIKTAEPVPATGPLGRLCAPGVTEVFHLVRIASVNNEPLCQLEGYYHLDVGVQLDLEAIERHGVYHELNRMGIHPHTSDAVLNIEFANLQTSSRLTVPAGAPLYRVDCWTSDRSGQEVEFSRELDRTDRFEFAFSATSVRAVELVQPNVAN